jgi:histidine ammonia-lyase
VSMGMTAALKLMQSAGHCRMVLAIEWMTATRALDIHGDHFVSPALDAARAAFRIQCPAWEQDRILSTVMNAADRFLATANWKDGLTPQEALQV